MSTVDTFFLTNDKKIKSLIKKHHHKSSYQDIEDIYQQSYTHMKFNEQKVDAARNPTSYLFISILNYANNYFKRGFQARVVDKNMAVSIFYNSVYTLDTRNVYNIVMDHIETLPEQQKRAILLRTEADTLEEFTTAMSDCKPETARHHYFLARRKLVDFVKNIEYSIEDKNVENVYEVVDAKEEDY